MPDFQFVDLSVDNTLDQTIGCEQVIALDTEFVREKTFFSHLCLIQVAAGDEIYCADPLDIVGADSAGGDRFWEALMNTAWVLHSGRQDVEVLYQASGRMPTDIFDTQIAAALLGYQPQMGYAGLVAELFDVELAKTHTRADWSRRPLPDAYMDYAAEDVLYLLPARQILSEKLDKLGRLSWAIEDSADLLQVSLYDSNPELAINRLKGAGKLRGHARSAAHSLAVWREKQALQRNRPRQWIIRDPVLLELATSDANSLDDLKQISGLAERTIERSGRQLLELLAEAADQKSDYVPPARPDEKQKKLLKDLQRCVTSRAESLGIATEIVAPKKELSAAVMGTTDSRVFKGWRRSLVGDELLELLDGR